MVNVAVVVASSRGACSGILQAVSVESVMLKVWWCSSWLQCRCMVVFVVRANSSKVTAARERRTVPSLSHENKRLHKARWKIYVRPAFYRLRRRCDRLRHRCILGWSVGRARQSLPVWPLGVRSEVAVPKGKHATLGVGVLFSKAQWTLRPHYERLGRLQRKLHKHVPRDALLFLYLRQKSTR